jgi:hypothetical protein
MEIDEQNTIVSSTDWFNLWEAQDYSWDRLVDKSPPVKNEGGDLQYFWRALVSSRQPSDDQLVSDGILFPCADKGLFHFLFIPPKWANEIPNFPLNEQELIDKQNDYWLKNANKFDTYFGGILEGVFLSQKAHERLISGSNAQFKFVDFYGEVRHLIRKTSRDFENCSFSSRVLINGKHPKSNSPVALSFVKCIFHEDVKCEDLDCSHDLVFDSCFIRTKLELKQSSISSFKIHSSDLQRLNVIGTSINGTFQILNSVANSGFEMIDSIISGEFHLGESTISGFLHAIGCDFQSRARFVDMEWPSVGFLVATGNGSTFNSEVTFASNNPPPIQFFENIQIKSSINMSGFSEKQWRSAFKRELEWVPQEGEGHYSEIAHINSLESACRNLRKIEETSGNVHLEHIWHRAEIIARTSGSDSSFWEKSVSKLYGQLADYGLSIWRPFAWLFGLMTLMSIFYALSVSGVRISAINWELYGQSLNFSAERMLPLGLFDDIGDFHKKFLGADRTAGWSSIGARAVATIQSIISVILIYLGIMAIRRKFKIS